MRFTEISESYLDKYKKYTRPVTKTTPKIEKTSNPLGRTTNHVEWKVTGNTGEVRRFQSKQEAQDYYDSCTKNVTEAGSPAQQAAIAIAMKKAGKKPKQGVAEGLLNELDMFAPVTTYVRLANGEYVAASWRRNQAVTGGNSASFIDIKPLAPNVAKQLGLDKRLNDPDKNQNGTASIASGGGVQSSMPFSDKTIEVVDIMDKKFAKDMGVPDAVFGKIAQWSQQQGVTEAATPVTHRIGLTVTDPNHPMVSKRGETYQKSVRVTGPDREAAINQAIAHHRRKGYKVHDHHYLGTVDQGVTEGSDYTPPKLGTVKANLMNTQKPTAQVQVFKHNTLRGDSYWVTKEVKTFKTMDQAQAYVNRINKQGVTEGTLEEIDRRGFLRGLGAATMAGATNSAMAALGSPTAPRAQVKVPPVPQLPARDGDLGNGNRVTTNKDGTRTYSGGFGSFTYNAQGEAITYSSPNFNGQGQTIDLTTNQITQNYNTGPLKIKQTTDATGKQVAADKSYDLGAATVRQQTDATGKNINTANVPVDDTTHVVDNPTLRKAFAKWLPEGSEASDNLVSTLNSFGYYSDNSSVYANDDGDKIARQGSNWKHQSGQRGTGAEELGDFLSSQEVDEGENWSKHNNKRAGGMSKKSVASYRRSHPGSKIQTAVTTKPSKLKKGSKAAARRKSFCARMRGMKKHRTGAKTARDPNSNINKSLRRWHCESIEELHELVMIAEKFIRNNKK